MTTRSLRLALLLLIPLALGAVALAMLLDGGRDADGAAGQGSPGKRHGPGGAGTAAADPGRAGVPGLPPSVPGDLEIPAEGLLPVLFMLEDFEAVDQGGRTFSSTSLEGRVWVADFIFTNCGGPCPKMTAAMKQLQDRTADHSDLHFVTITVDPERDTPEVLRSYAERHGADLNRWRFLRTTPEKTGRLMQEVFKVGYKDSLLNHSARFILVDQKGLVRGTYDGLDVEGRIDLRRDALTLLTGERP